MDFDVSNLSWVEAVWIAVSLTGLYYGWTNLRESKLDRLQAEHVQNGLRAARIVVADGYVYRNRLRVGIFVWWSFLGFMFGFFDPPELPRVGGLLGLIVTAAAFAFKGMQESNERRTLAAIVANQEEADEVEVASDTIERRAAIVAAQLEVVAQEAALNLRKLARLDDNGMAADQRRSADASERTADATEELLERDDREVS